MTQLTKSKIWITTPATQARDDEENAAYAHDEKESPPQRLSS
ncbi:MAG TPA: hypothetical protein VHA13_01795 [Gammaproteobacteria bacterium]|nr:hypothetical protein [Gammaproteobacteria bacterium]